MLARIHIQLPFTLTIPKTETFTVWEYELEGYGVRIYPPLMSTTSAIPEGQQILINEQEAIQVDILWIDFRKEEFDRDPQTACDPPYQTINSAANDFIERLRYVAKAPNIKQIELPYTSWNLTYLEDDEKELAEQEGLIRGRGARAFSFSWTALNQDVWNDVNKELESQS